MRKTLCYLIAIFLIIISIGCAEKKRGYIIYSPGGFNTSAFDIENREKAMESIVGKFETLLPPKPIGLVLVCDDPGFEILLNIIYDKLVNHGANVSIVREEDIDKAKKLDYLLYLHPVVMGERHIYSFVIPPPRPRDDNAIVQTVWRIMMEGWGIRSLLGASAEGRGSTVRLYLRLDKAKTGKVEMIEDKRPRSTVGKEIKL